MARDPKEDYDEETELLLARNPRVAAFLYRKYVDPRPAVGLYMFVSELSRKPKK